MDAFFKWLSSNMVFSWGLVIIVVGIILCILLIYFIAFLQGREISFWPPKIGTKNGINSTDVKNYQKSFFIKRMPDLRERLSKAKSIDIDGISLAGTSNLLLTTLRERIESGSKIRILITEPNTKAVEVGVFRVEKHQDVNQLNRSIEHALENFATLYNCQNGKENFQLNVFPFHPGYGIWVIDADTADAEIWVEIYSKPKSVVIYS